MLGACVEEGHAARRASRDADSCGAAGRRIAAMAPAARRSSARPAAAAMVQPRRAVLHTVVRRRIPFSADARMNKIERALSLYEQWLAIGDAGALEAMCAAHPDLAEHLRALAADKTAVAEEIAAEEGLTLGKTLGDYRLVAELGRGGMGVVYLARQVSLDREVAVKVLPHHLTLQAATVARFRREANLAARLVHPGIVAIHTVGKDGDAHYFAMERIPGQRLARVDQRTGARRTVLECVEIAAAVADALAYAHSQGVLHRDVKPSNILVRDDGQPVLTDFGLAREIGALRITKSGAYAGTPAYSAPEQIAGSKHVDGRADVWSLGATLYELLTERLPFPGDSDHEVLHRIRFDEPLDPLRVVPDLAPDLTAIVLKALEKDPERRYASAGDLRDDLRAFLEHRPIRARRATRAQRIGRWLQRHPAWRAALAVAGIGLVALPWLLSLAVAGERDRAVAAERMARRQAYAANVLAAQNALANGDRGQAEQRLAACPDDLRGFEWHLVARSLDRSVWTASVSVARITAVALAGDAEWIATGDRNGEVALFVPGEATPRWRRRLGAQPVAALAIDEAGTYVVAASADGAVRSFAVADGACLGEAGPLEAQPPEGSGNTTVAIAPDATTVVRAVGGGRFARLDAPLLADERVLALPAGLDHPTGQFASNGVRLLAHTANTCIAQWDLRQGARGDTSGKSLGGLFFVSDHQLAHGLACTETGDFTWWQVGAARLDTGHVGRRAVVSTAVAADGTRFAIGCNNGEILVHTTRTAVRLARILNGHRGGVRSLAAGSGGWLVSGGDNGEVKLWNMLLDAGAGEVTVAQPPLGGGGPSLAIEGDTMWSGGMSGIVRRTDRRSGHVVWETQLPHWVNGMALVEGGATIIATYHNALQALSARDGALLGEPSFMAGMNRARRFLPSPDGSRIAMLDEDGRVGIVDVRSRQMVSQRRVVSIEPNRVHGAFAWTSDGTRLAVGDDRGVVHLLAADTLATVGELAFGNQITALAIDGDELFVAQWDVVGKRGALDVRSLATGAVRATQALTSSVTEIGLLPDRLAIARRDARLALHYRDDLTTLLELPQPCLSLWQVLAAPSGDWIGVQCLGGEPRVLAARSDPPTLAESRAWARDAMAVEAAVEAFGDTSWTPRARAALQRRRDLPPDVRDAAVAALPPTGPYFLGLHIELAVAADPADPAERERLQMLLACLREATTPMSAGPEGNGFFSLQALAEFRLGEVAAAEATLQRIEGEIDQTQEFAAYVHFVRTRLCLLRGDLAGATAAAARLRQVADRQRIASRTRDLLREVEALLAR
jgi:WD40 repeat protein